MFIGTGFFNIVNVVLELVIIDGIDFVCLIVIVFFKWEGVIKLFEDVFVVIVFDLQCSGKFSLVLISKMLQMFYSEEQVNFGKWIFMGVDLLLMGMIM